MTKRVSTAETAHLVGPGCVRLEGKVPVWQPVEGQRLQLHPQYLRRVLCYGNVDFSTAVLHQFWRREIQVVFLSPSGHSMLGKLQPGGNSPNLARLQHLAAANDKFCASIASELVEAKLQSCIATARYYQQQGKTSQGGRLIGKLNRIKRSATPAKSVAQLRGIEGIGAVAWFNFLRTIIPPEWGFDKRVAHPPTDPVNALLSLGYSLANRRCETLLAAADLDPRVGFLHEIRAGRPSLACDLMEPLRAPLVDRLVVGMLARKVIVKESFDRQGVAWRLRPEPFKKVLGAFEQAFEVSTSQSSIKQQTLKRIENWSERIRHFEVDK